MTNANPLRILVADRCFSGDTFFVRTNKDEVLGNFSRKLAAVKFATPIDLNTTQLAELRDVHARNKHKHVVVLNNNSNMVSLYCGGSLRCITTIATDFVSACRIADMALLRMGKWRLQRPKDVAPSEYNFSEQQAQKDWDAENEIRALLEGVEKHLRSIGALLDPANPNPVQRQQQPRQQTMFVSVEAFNALVARVFALEEKIK